jgi:cobalt-zinc-cadmium resistance protein CzcA
MNALVAFAIRQRVPVSLLSLFLMGVGVVRFLPVNVEASPAPPLVDFVTHSARESAEEIERHITSPVETQLAGIPNVTEIRSSSLLGLSDITLQFNHNVNHAEAQQWVIKQLSQVSGLPGNATPEISPSSPIGDTFRYRGVGSPGDAERVVGCERDRNFYNKSRALSLLTLH